MHSVFDVSVVIPVGPSDANKRWLFDALASIAGQTWQPARVILIDDRIADETMRVFAPKLNVSLYRPPWRLGVAHAFNFGVALAPTECVVMLGSDDTLEPACLEYCRASYLKHEMASAYYSLDVKYMNSGEEQSIPCNAAMVTKDFWRMTGGFPIESAAGAPDAALLSICMAHKLRVIRVDTPHPMYNYRDHDGTYTKLRPKWHQLIIDMRNLITEEWKPLC